MFSEPTAKTANNSTTVIGGENAAANPVGGSLSFGSYPLGANGQTPLAPPEQQIPTCLAQGKSNKAIARLYNLSEATVKVHLKAILRKINAQNRTRRQFGRSSAAFVIML